MEELKKKRKRTAKPSELLETPLDALDKILAKLSQIQQKALLDTARFVLARCSRRSGKTFLDAAKLIHTSLKYPGDTSIYFGLTRESAKEAIWEELLKQLNENQIAHAYSEPKLEITLANGARIRLIGADMEKIKDRLRGRKFRLVIVDECAFFAQVDRLILEVLLATLADYQGQLYMTSSPGKLPKGLFYEADEGRLKDNWSRYHWTGGDNPHFQQPATNPKFKTLWEQELDTIVTMQFEGDWENPTFRREYLGEWVFDGRSLAYALSAEAITDKPRAFRQAAYALGVNIAEQGKQGFTVIKYGEFDREVQVMEVRSTKIRNLDELATEISTFLDKYKTNRIIVYLGNNDPEILDSFKARYSLPLFANRYDKSPHNLAIVSTDLQANRILVDSSCKPLIEEWQKIVKDDQGNELDGQTTLLSDAFFAIYLKIYNTYLKQAVKAESDEERMERQLLERVGVERQEHFDEFGFYQ